MGTEDCPEINVLDGFVSPGSAETEDSMKLGKAEGGSTPLYIEFVGGTSDAPEETSEKNNIK